MPLWITTREGSVYLLRNTVNGKGYVGQHSKGKVEDRWQRHFSDSKAGSNLSLHRAIRKYGFENFEKVVLWTGPTDKLNEMEEHFIKQLNTFTRNGQGYNATFGGKTMRGFTHTEESKLKMAASNRIATIRRFSDPEERAKLSARQLERYCRPGQKERQSENNRKRYQSQEARNKTSEAMQKAFLDPKTREKFRSVQIERFKDPRERQKLSEAQKQRWARWRAERLANV